MKTGPKFFTLLSKALASFEEKWLCMIGIGIITVGLGTYLELLSTTLVNGYAVKGIAARADGAAVDVIKVPFDLAMKSEIIGGVLGGIIAGFLGLIMVAAVIHLVKSKNAKFLGSIFFGLKNSGRLVLAALYVLWYTLGWILILIMGFLTAEFLAKFSKYGLAAVLGTKVEVDPMRETVANVIQEMSAGYFGGINLFLIVFGIVIMFVVIYRSIKATFTYFALMDEAKTGIKDAVKKSVEAVQGNFGRVLLYLLALSLTVSAIMGVIGLAAEKLVADMQFAEQINMLVAVILTGVLVPMVITFEYHFYKALKK